MFFEINTSNFQEIFLDIFRKFWLKKFKKKKKNIIKKLNKKKTVYFLFI